jgi:serine kinase of HPr protein (carbohydrate metabolism regulator)
MSAPLANVSCVAIDGPQGPRAVLIDGEPGSGKSSLALALIDRGARLVGDDGVTLEDRSGLLWALPPPHTADLIEVRNLGLARLPATSAPLALVIRLDPEAPRFIEHAGRAMIEGHWLPSVALWPDTPALPLRAELALKMHGLG